MSKRRYPCFPIPGVGAIVVGSKGVLLVRRDKDPGKGLWSIPGGGVEYCCQKVGHSWTFYYRCLYNPDRTVRCRVHLGQEPSPQDPTLPSPRVARGLKMLVGEAVRRQRPGACDAASMNQEPNIDHGL